MVVITETEKFQLACLAPVDLDKCYTALQTLINGEHRLHVPPELDDADMLISRALRELKEHRGTIEHQEETIEKLEIDVNDWKDEYMTLKRRFEELDKSALETLELLREGGVSEHGCNRLSNEV